jgi:hypothetical protein
MVYSEVELNLPTKWFTGSEWSDGTAQRWHREQYKTATEKAEKSHRQRARGESKSKPRDYVRPVFEDNKGLSPMEICRRAMRRP